MNALFRQPTPAELELLRLRDELSALRKTLAAREHQLAELRAHLLSFEGRYLRQVGLLYKKLDQWERKRAELHSNPDSASGEDPDWTDLPPVEREPDPQSLDLRSLFRELARRIHPDRSTDAADEQRRTRLMAQANDAFVRKDRRALERMLNGFEAPHTVSGVQAIEAKIADTRAQIDTVREDVGNAEAEHDALAHSELAQLEAEVIKAARSGRDLLAEMAARVQGRIGLAMRAYELDLDRLKRPAKGLRVEDLVTAKISSHPQPRWDAKKGRWVR